MADFKINGVTFANESSGQITLSNLAGFPSGHVVKSASLVFATRTVMSGSTGGSVPTKICDLGTYTKIRSDTHLYIYAMLAGHGNNSGSVGLGIRMGPSGTVIYGSYTYDENNTNKLASVVGRITDYTLTTPTNVEFVTHSRGNSSTGEKPFNGFCPSNSDDNRNPSGGTESHVNIFEVMPWVYWKF